MKVLHVSHSDLIGGAARAAYRLHMAQLDIGIESRMLVRTKLSDNWTITGPSTKFERICNLFRSPIGHQINKLQRSKNINFHSGGWLSSHWAKKINASDVDIVNLHWVAGETMSIEDIGRINKPIVWTLHDMWPFCGTEHVTDYGIDARWKVGYYSQNRGKLEQGIDLDRIAWLRKRKAWKNKYFHIVVPSRWMAECAISSSLFKNYPVTLIPNVLDTNVYKPLNQSFCRNLLNLPEGKEIILFGAMGGGKDPNKGYDLLIEALNILSYEVEKQNIVCVIFGQDKPKNVPSLPFETIWVGHIYDDEKLVLLYNSATVMVVPSRQEAFGQTASEALSCGIPVVAFKTTGLNDIVEHLKTGYLAESFCTRSLVDGIKWVLNINELDEPVHLNARNKSLCYWSRKVVLSQYLSVYSGFK